MAQAAVNEITPFDPLPLPQTVSLALRCSLSRLSRGTYPYRPSCITRRLLSPLYDIGNPKTRIKVPPPLRRRRDIHCRVASRDVAADPICIRRSRREVKDVCKSTGAIVPWKAEFSIRMNRTRRWKSTVAIAQTIFIMNYHNCVSLVTISVKKWMIIQLPDWCIGNDEERKITNN